MRTIILLLLSVICVELSYGADIRGAVLDENGNPSANQVISLFPCFPESMIQIDDSLLAPPPEEDVLTIYSDHNGVFEFTGLQGGCYILSVLTGTQGGEDTEYRDMRIDLIGKSTNVTICPSEVEYWDLDFSLKSADNGIPIKARVQFMPDPTDAESAASVERIMLVSETYVEDGVFIKKKVPVGKYRIWLSGIPDIAYSIPINIEIDYTGNTKLDSTSLSRMEHNGIEMNITIQPAGQ